MFKTIIFATAALATATACAASESSEDKNASEAAQQVASAVETTTTEVVETSKNISKASHVVLSGKFEGRNKHITTGGVSIVKTASGYIAILEGDFSLDGAPAPTLGFGKDGFDAKSEFTKLNSNDGLQVYALPASIDPMQYDEFYVWCADFSVSLGVASLK